MSMTPKDATVHIREVWADNFEQEFQLIREIVHDYPYLATTDSRFLGFVMEPDGKFLNGRNIADYHHPTMRANADSMKLIQLGLTFSDEEGNLPSCGTTDKCIWQFNFTDVNPNRDLHEFAIELLQRSGIIDAQRVHIREVWVDNLEQEFQLIREIVHDYPYLAIMDTQFLGFVVKPDGKFFDGRNVADYYYPTMRANADSVKLIQLELRLSDEEGNLPSCGKTDNCMWRFNFRDFNLNEDLHAYDAIELLQQSGIDFQANAERGVDSERFRELLMSSGVMFNENIHWTSHGSYDLGYLLKLLTCQNLPSGQDEYFNLLRTYFPTLHDTKYATINTMPRLPARLPQTLDMDSPMKRALTACSRHVPFKS